MSFIRILWDDPDDPDGNVQHVAEHGLDIEDVEEVLANPTSQSVSQSTGRPCVWGYMAHLKKSDTQQRKYNPRRSAGRLAIDCSFRRVRRLSSSLVFA